MPSKDAYDQRAQSYLDTYGDSEWVEIRVNESINVLSQTMIPRSDRGKALFMLLGIGSNNIEDSLDLTGVLESFSQSERIRAVSAYLSLATNLMSGYTFKSDWDNLLQELMIPEQRYSKLTLNEKLQIALLHDEIKENLPDEPSFVSLKTEAEIMSKSLCEVDLDTFRLDVLKKIVASANMSRASLIDNTEELSEIDCLTMTYDRLSINYDEIRIIEVPKVMDN